MDSYISTALTPTAGLSLWCLSLSVRKHTFGRWRSWSLDLCLAVLLKCYARSLEVTGPVMSAFQWGMTLTCLAERGGDLPGCVCAKSCLAKCHPEQKVTQKRESVIKPQVLYTAALPFLEMSLRIKDSALNSSCCRHGLHYVLHARTHWNSVQREKENHFCSNQRSDYLVSTKAFWVITFLWRVRWFLYA